MKFNLKSTLSVALLKCSSMCFHFQRAYQRNLLMTDLIQSFEKMLLNRFPEKSMKGLKWSFYFFKCTDKIKRPFDLNLSLQCSAFPQSGNSSHSNSSMMSGSANSVINFTHQQQVSDEGNSNLWPTGAEDIAAPSTHISVNGFSSGFQNYSAPLFNGGVSVAVAPNHQHPRRAITASHTGNGSGTNLVSGYSQHHGLSPTAIGRNSSMHQQSNMSGGQQQNHHQNLFKNSYPAWSNPPPSIAWPLQSNQNHQAALGAWNRGRSVPNLNPLSTGMQQTRKPTSPNPPCHSPFGSLINSGAQGGMGGQNSSISPMKYRRSTSFPGKVSVGPLEISNIDDARDSFMAYQVIS